MPNSGWKDFERRVAKRIGGKRRGADTEGGKCDIIHDAFAPECGLFSTGSLNYQTLLDKVRQSERNAPTLRTPIAIVKRKGDRDDDALVLMRLRTWEDWYGPGNSAH